MVRSPGPQGSGPGVGGGRALSWASARPCGGAPGAVATLWPGPCLCWCGGSHRPSRQSLTTSPASSPRASSPTPVLGPGLLGARLTWPRLAGQPWLELTSQQVSLGRGGHERTHRPERAPRRPGTGKEAVGNCVWLLESPPPSQPSPPPPPCSNGEADCCFTVLISTVAVLHPGRISGGWVTPGSSSWVMFTVLSAPHWGPPEDTPPPTLFSRGAPRHLPAVFRGPGARGRMGAVSAITSSLLAQWTGAPVLI